MQLELPVEDNMLVTAPGGHVTQATIGDGENLPIAQMVQDVAPSPARVFVAEPVEQTVHAMVELMLYWPGAQFVQLEPPRSVRVLVTAPAGQMRQLA